MSFKLDKIKLTLERAPKEFNNLVAQIGVPSGAFYDNGTSVGKIAAIQEFGAPAKSIPARPFVMPTVKDKKNEWVNILKQSIPNVISGKESAFDTLYTVGEFAAADMREALINVNSPSLSPITVLLRKWRKEGRTITGKTVGEAAAAIKAGVDVGNDNKPLNDTGVLLAHIKNGVNKEGEQFKV